MSCSALLRVVTVTLLLSLPGCSRRETRSVERIAIVAFDNLSRSPDTGWAGRGVSHLAALLTAGDARIQTFEVATVRDAHSRYATQTISGYLTDDAGALTLHATVRDETTGRTLRAFTASDRSGSVSTIARAVAAETGAPVRGDARLPAQAAMRTLLSSSAEDPREALATVERALAADGDYGAAQLARVELLARLGQRDALPGAIQQARSASLTSRQRAQLDVLAAELEGNRAARAAALTRLGQLSPGSLAVWRAAADAQMNARQYEEAVRACNAILELAPEDETALNVRGYAYTYAGQADRAREAFEDYRRRRPDSANAIDSLGESMFYFGRFSEAERLFLEAHAKNPAHVNGNERFRAALSRFMSGDIAGADTLFAQFLADRRKQKDPLAETRALLWQCITGRMPRTTSPEPLHQIVQAMWTLAAGDRYAAREMASRARTAAPNPSVASLASLTILLAQPSASSAEWTARLQGALPPQIWQAQGRRLLGWALLLDRKPADAARVWREIYNSLPPDAANTERILLTWSLADSGQNEEARKVMRHGFLPPPALDPGLELLVYPKAREIRSRLSS